MCFFRLAPLRNRTVIVLDLRARALTFSFSLEGGRRRRHRQVESALVRSADISRLQKRCDTSRLLMSTARTPSIVDSSTLYRS